MVSIPAIVDTASKPRQLADTLLIRDTKSFGILFFEEHRQPFFEPACKVQVRQLVFVHPKHQALIRFFDQISNKCFCPEIENEILREKLKLLWDSKNHKKEGES